VAAPTSTVVAVNVALVAPAATVTLAGTAAALLLLASNIAAPPVGAPDVNVTVLVDPVPPVTLDGLTERADREAGRLVWHHCTFAVTVALPFNVNVQVFVLLPRTSRRGAGRNRRSTRRPCGTDVFRQDSACAVQRRLDISDVGEFSYRLRKLQLRSFSR
jgi:hypothetical protein